MTTLMTRAELRKKHKMHAEYGSVWKFNELAYKGGKNFINEVIDRNERESYFNATQRKNEAIDFNYTKEVVDLFNFYLTEKIPNRSLPGLEKNKQWALFVKNANMHGSDLNSFLNSSQKRSSICGTAGILVNKPISEFTTREKELEHGIYPYCSMYTMPNIYDWKYGHNPHTGIPELVYLKLYEGENSYLLWWIDRWERWEINEESTTSDECRKTGTGKYSLEKIPWIWLRNLEGDDLPYLGSSDINDIAMINASIVRNVSCGEEVIKWAAFPMYRKPMEAEGKETESKAGVTNVIETDPGLDPAFKPDWLESAAKDPIEAILAWIGRKIEELHRTCHLSGVHGQRKNQEASSGLALKYEFQQLVSILSKKSVNLDAAERHIVELWCLWQNESPGEIEIKRSKNFSIDDMQIDLENSLVAMQNVASKTFRIQVQSKMAKKELPDITDDVRKTIVEEIVASDGILPDLPELKKAA